MNPNINLKDLGHKVLNDQQGEIESLILITVTNHRTGSAVIGGSKSQISELLVSAMKENPMLREAFETAWAAITKAEIGLN